MKNLYLPVILSVMLALIFSSCAPKATENSVMDQPVEKMMEEPTEVMMDESTDSDRMEESSEDEMMAPASDSDMAIQATPTAGEMMEQPASASMMEAPEWFTVQLTDVKTGDTFNINDLKGKVVLVETMAQWCSNCLKQQKQVMALHSLLAEDNDLVSIALDIDPNEDEASLKAYAQDHGFNWVYVIAPAEVSREIGNLYTAQFINPPSTPILIIDRSGEAHPLPFGIKSADDLKQAIEPFLNEGM